VRASIGNGETIETYDWDDSVDFSSGVLAFHWSIDKRVDALNTHNVFLVADDRLKAEESWRAVRNPTPAAEDDSRELHNTEPCNFYVHRAAKTDSTAAPEGCDSIMVLVPCQSLRRVPKLATLTKAEAMEEYHKQFSSELIDHMRSVVLERLAVLPDLEDLRDHIAHESIESPATYADLYNVGAGVPFGMVRPHTQRVFHSLFSFVQVNSTNSFLSFCVERLRDRAMGFHN
jgi:phytoene desaturase (3,4-didehydrolycopene-forming)